MPEEVYHNIIFCQYDEDWTRKVHESTGSREIEVRWKVKVNNDELIGAEVLRQLRQVVQADDPHPTPVQPYDPVPYTGYDYCREGTAYFDHLGYADQGIFCDSVDCELVDPKDPTLFRVMAIYRPPTDKGPEVVGKYPVDDDPLKWEPEAMVSFIEDQVPIEQARCMGFFALPESLDAYDEGYDKYNTLDKYIRGFVPLSQLDRGRINDFGAIVNAAGQQTVDPQEETAYRVVYSIKVNYPNDHYAWVLNQRFVGTVHGSEAYYNSPVFGQYDISNPVISPGIPSPLLFGYPHGTWKFLVAEAEKMNYRRRGNTIVSFCPTVIKFEIKLGKLLGWMDYAGNYMILPFNPSNPTEIYTPLYSGWNRLVLNNGQTAFRKIQDKYESSGPRWIEDPRFGSSGPSSLPNNIRYLSDDNGHIDITNPRFKLLFPTVSMRFKESSLKDFKYVDDRTDATDLRRMPTINDMEEVETSEPVNLNYDGTQSTDPLTSADHIWYQNLKIANYDLITNYYGDKLINSPLIPEMPRFPFGTKTDEELGEIPIPKCPDEDWGS